MKKRVFREKYGETKVEFVKEVEPTENVADVVIEKPKKKKTTTKKGKK